MSQVFCDNSICACETLRCKHDRFGWNHVTSRWDECIYHQRTCARNRAENLTWKLLMYINLNTQNKTNIPSKILLQEIQLALSQRHVCQSHVQWRLKQHARETPSVERTLHAKRCRKKRYDSRRVTFSIFRSIYADPVPWSAFQKLLSLVLREHGNANNYCTVTASSHVLRD